MSLTDWSLHVSLQPADLERVGVRQPGTDYKVPLSAWLRAASAALGGDSLKRKQLSIYCWDRAQEEPIPTVPPHRSQPKPEPKPAAGAWRAGTLVGFDHRTSVFSVKYHSDPKRQVSHLYLPLTVYHFARTPPPPGTPPSSATHNLPPVLLPPMPFIPKAPAAGKSGARKGGASASAPTAATAHPRPAPASAPAESRPAARGAPAAPPLPASVLLHPMAALPAPPAAAPIAAAAAAAAAAAHEAAVRQGPALPLPPVMATIAAAAAAAAGASPLGPAPQVPCVALPHPVLLQEFQMIQQAQQQFQHFQQQQQQQSQHQSQHQQQQLIQQLLQQKHQREHMHLTMAQHAAAAAAGMAAHVAESSFALANSQEQRLPSSDGAAHEGADRAVRKRKAGGGNANGADSVDSPVLGAGSGAEAVSPAHMETACAAELSSRLASARLGPALPHDASSSRPPRRAASSADLARVSGGGGGGGGRAALVAMAEQAWPPAASPAPPADVAMATMSAAAAVEGMDDTCAARSSFTASSSFDHPATAAAAAAVVAAANLPSGPMWPPAAGPGGYAGGLPSGRLLGCGNLALPVPNGLRAFLSAHSFGGSSTDTAPLASSPPAGLPMPYPAMVSGAGATGTLVPVSMTARAPLLGPVAASAPLAVPGLGMPARGGGGSTSGTGAASCPDHCLDDILREISHAPWPAANSLHLPGQMPPGAHTGLMAAAGFQRLTPLGGAPPPRDDGALGSFAMDTGGSAAASTGLRAGALNSGASDGNDVMYGMSADTELLAVKQEGGAGASGLPPKRAKTGGGGGGFVLPASASEPSLPSLARASPGSGDDWALMLEGMLDGGGTSDGGPGCG
ncbi:hypothetical protein HYH03_000070 [Edaphochlamys debaryana]|uniref:Uncharacterized protein n=1 Tax=Edaphochlamys debaryana TaxID=47281 RepID=A0A835YI00_9CHLO|nr:hypothetical protein HYH03_000070 [Edaphochlamys debaryana]|eukprot:KAG2501563.1 hypothetical protein HYH03_000070 [Edaphochlamys debaryana]